MLNLTHKKFENTPLSVYTYVVKKKSYCSTFYYLAQQTPTKSLILQMIYVRNIGKRTRRYLLHCTCTGAV